MSIEYDHGGMTSAQVEYVRKLCSFGWPNPGHVAPPHIGKGETKIWPRQPHGCNASTCPNGKCNATGECQDNPVR